MRNRGFDIILNEKEAFIKSFSIENLNPIFFHRQPQTSLHKNNKQFIIEVAVFNKQKNKVTLYFLLQPSVNTYTWKCPEYDQTLLRG